MIQEAEYQTQNMFESEFSTYVHKYERDRPVPPHFHKSFEIITVIKGSCKCLVNKTEYILQDKDSIFISPFDIHSFSLNEGAEVRRVTFHEHFILTVSQTLNGRKPLTPMFHAREESTVFFIELMEIVWQISFDITIYRMHKSKS